MGEEKIKLERQEAVDLWMQGKEAWNNWVKKNPVADVSFEGMNFSKIRKQKNLTTISFTGFIFPTGDVSFQRTTFGDGDVSFEYTNFRGGDISFWNATFGNGDISFLRAAFGNSNVIFYGTLFGDGNISFDRTSFGNGYVTFGKATLGNGDISFYKSTFRGGDISFVNTTLGEGIYNFETTQFKNNIVFDNVTETEKVKKFSFKHSSFEKSLILPETKFGCVIDLTNTKLGHQITLHNLECSLKRKPIIRWLGLYSKSKDPEDAARFRRLKEIAQNNKDHERALDFNAQEKRAKRWREYGPAASILDMIYSAISNYGQSILRPLLGLLFIIDLFTGFHILYTNTDNTRHAFEYTLANSLPFLASTRAVIKSSKDQLYCSDTNKTPTCVPVPIGLDFLTFIQGILTIIFLFFIGLGLRNRFKI